jgi:hypothetical protein
LAHGARFPFSPDPKKSLMISGLKNPWKRTLH